MEVPLQPPYAFPRAKVCVPAGRAYVARPRLLESIERTASMGGVTLVIAPGGAGKTALAASWAAACRRTVAWYSVDRADCDVRRLLRGLCAAVEVAQPGQCAAVVAAIEQGEQELAALGLLLSLLDGTPLTLVLDDLHRLDGVEEVAQLWDHLFLYRPTTLSVVLLSRAIPQLPFSFMAAVDTIASLGRADLAFDAHEAEELLRAHRLPELQGSALAKRCSGWAAGVLLLGRREGEGPRLLFHDDDAVFGYMATELLGTLPKPLREFVLESATICPASAPVTEQILGREGAAEAFAEVMRLGLFLEQRNGMFIYHDLLVDYCVRALRAQDPGRLAAISRTAARYWGAHGDVPRAFSILADCMQWGALAELLTQERDALWEMGLWGTIVAAVEALPPEYQSATLLALCGHARRVQGMYDAALCLADQALAVAQDDQGWLRGALLQAHVLYDAARYAEGLLALDGALPVAARAARADGGPHLRNAMHLRGITLLELGRFDEGLCVLQTALHDFETKGQPAQVARLLSDMATMLAKCGQRHAATAALDRATSLAEAKRLGPTLAFCQLTRAMLSALAGDFTSAAAVADESLELARVLGLFHQMRLAQGAYARLCTDAGDAPEGMAVGCDALKAALLASDAEAMVEGYRASIAAAIALHDTATARGLLLEARGVSVLPADAAILDFYDGALALRLGANRRAIQLLQVAAGQLEATMRPHEAARALLFLAEASHRAGRVRATEAALNNMATIVARTDCAGYLLPIAPGARRVLRHRRQLQRLRAGTYALLDALARSVPGLGEPGDGSEGHVRIEAVVLCPFGPGRAMHGKREVPIAAVPARARELLFYLSLRGEAVVRANLGETLWPGSSARSAQRLWHATHQLRRLFGDGCLSRAGPTLALEMPIEDLARRASSLTAAALAGGPAADPDYLLGVVEEGMALFAKGPYLAWCESEWAMVERSRLQAEAQRLGLLGAALYEQQGRYDDATRLCRQVIDLDQYDERGWTCLVRVALARGRIADARSQYSEYAALVQADLGTRPPPDLRRLVAEQAPRQG